jgi:AraC-like DNA-binding protein
MAKPMLDDWDPEYVLLSTVKLSPLPVFGLSLKDLITAVQPYFDSSTPERLVYAGSGYGLVAPLTAAAWNFTRPHTHAFVEIVIPLGGRARLVLGDGSSVLDAAQGQIGVITSGVVHNEMAESASQFYRLCWLRAKPGTAYIWVSEYQPGSPPRFGVSQMRRIAGVDAELLARTEVELSERKPAFEPAVSAYLRAFYYTLLRASEQREGGGSTHLAETVSAYIDEHFSHAVSIQTLADRLSLNPSYLCTAFKRQTGVTVGTYLTGVRLRHAMNLLRTTNMPVGLIGEQCGFRDVYRFSRVFRQSTGETPSHFRKFSRNLAAED